MSEGHKVKKNKGPVGCANEDNAIVALKGSKRRELASHKLLVS